jgi:hypothetical protein
MQIRLEIEAPAKAIGDNSVFVDPRRWCRVAPGQEKTGDREAQRDSFELKSETKLRSPPLPMRQRREPYSVSITALSQSTSPASSSGVPTSMVAPCRSAEGSCDRSHCRYPMPVTMSSAKR